MGATPVQSPDLTTANVVVDSSVGTELDLDEISEDITGAQYIPENFNGIVYRLTDPKATLLIFRSGAIVCTGTGSVDDARVSVDRGVNKLESLGVPVANDIEVQVQNIVLNGDLESEVNLNALAIGLGLENAEYEPEQFPGLVYQIEGQDTVALIFGSGKVVITGATSVEEGKESMIALREQIETLGLL